MAGGALLGSDVMRLFLSKGRRRQKKKTKNYKMFQVSFLAKPVRRKKSRRGIRAAAQLGYFVVSGKIVDQSFFILITVQSLASASSRVDCDM